MNNAHTDAGLIEEFLGYLEEFESTDERYGAPSRHHYSVDDRSAVRFATESAWFFEVGVESRALRVRVAFVTDETGQLEEVKKSIEESGMTYDSLILSSMEETGVAVDSECIIAIQDQQGTKGYGALLQIEDLVDLTEPRIRTTVIKMLEGILIAFGPEVEVDGWEDCD